MILPFLLALLAFVTLVAVMLPLLRPNQHAVEGTAFDRAVYCDQLRELDRDIGRGLLSEAEAQATRLEIQRRLLATEQAAAPAASAAPGSSRLMIAMMAAFVFLGSIGLYIGLGDPARPDMPLASRPDGQPDAQAAIRQAVTRLEEQLKTEPDNPDGWLLLARASLLLGRLDRAASAAQKAVELGRKDPETLGTYGEILVARNEGRVTPPAQEAFAAVLKADPGNQMARFYLAVATGQGGEPRKAIDTLQALAAEMPSDSPARPEIARQIEGFARLAGIPTPEMAAGQPVAAAPGGPDADTMAAAAQMPEAERKAMVRGMVDRLAARLDSQPDDVDGWMRLGRARSVLGEADKAADAYERAAKLRPTDISIQLRALEALLTGLPATDPVPPRAIALLHRIEAVRPDEPAALWYLGLVAAQDRKPEKALAYWQRLQAVLPADSADAKTVRAAIEALKSR
ncbi:MAG: c-type cytochrome biogenesis protein CcmI [Acetobacteraceae bacterium]